MLLKSFLFSCLLAAPALAELTIPAFTVYGTPESASLKLDKTRGIVDWKNSELKVAWHGEFKKAGEVEASLSMTVPKGEHWKLKLTMDGKSSQVDVKGENGEPQVVSFGKFKIAKPGYAAFELESLNKDGKSPGEIASLILNGPPAEDAHFNLLPRRNAASVHLSYKPEGNPDIAMFYNEVTAVKDPLATYYMACGFSRGYFGMQVNSPTERRIIFSVWDSGAGGDAKDRSTVDEANQTQLVAKGEGVEAGVFGNEGTGGHSHLVYNWKTGEPQKFVVAVKPEGDFTTYSGLFFHPEKKAWMLIASFKAPHDGKWLRGLYSFNEDFGGKNSYLQRKALFGPQWICDSKGQWSEITKATFSHDGTGKADRLDRFMGVENGKFFLSNGGFVDGFTKYGEPFERPSSGKPPELKLP